MPAPGAAPWPRVQGESRVGHPQGVLWVTPSAPHHPRSSAGARGYLLIFTEAAAAPGWGGGGCVWFLLGFYLCFKGWVKKRKKETAPAPALAVAPGTRQRGGDRQGPPKPPLHASRGRVAPSLCAGSAQSPPLHHLCVFKSINKGEKPKPTVNVSELFSYLLPHLGMVPAVGWGGQGRGAPGLALPHKCRVCLGGRALPKGKGKGGGGAGRAPSPACCRRKDMKATCCFHFIFL